MTDAAGYVTTARGVVRAVVRWHRTRRLLWTVGVLVLLWLSAATAWEETGQWLVVAVVCVLGGLLWWRRLDADVVGAVALAVGMLQLAALDTVLTADVLILLALFRLGERGRARLRPLWAVALVAGAVLAALDWNKDEWDLVPELVPEDLYWYDFRSTVVILVGAGLLAWSAGRLAALRRDSAQARAAAERARQAEEQQRLAAQVAAVRTRTAQDVHDVVGHALALVAVQAEAGRYLVSAPREEVDLSDRERLDQARGVLETVLATTRKALTETRSLTHALAATGDEEGAAPLYPAPGLDALPSLVRDASRSGAPVRLTVRGDPGSHGTVDLGAQTALYRTAQEGITNAVRHAPEATRIDVELVHAPGGLTLTVTNDDPATRRGPGASAVPAGSGSRGSGASQGAGPLARRLGGTEGGLGLRSLRHRLETAGGGLRVVARPGGGVVLQALVPAAEAEAGPRGGQGPERPGRRGQVLRGGGPARADGRPGYW